MTTDFGRPETTGFSAENGYHFAKVILNKSVLLLRNFWSWGAPEKWFLFFGGGRAGSHRGRRRYRRCSGKKSHGGRLKIRLWICTGTNTRDGLHNVSLCKADPAGFPAGGGRGCGLARST
ncbi:MAG: hypothetical protein HQM08_30730 [Candidatus Riflebacteria bacterium]|nr:hypothetical protein [Candidatus Riflebacteria bacterium]